MRAITKKSVEAFYNSQPFREGNTEVAIGEDMVSYILFGNEIAIKSKYGNTLAVSNGGHPLTSTAKERLNGLNGVKVYTSKGIDYLNDEVWDGSTTKIE